MSGGAWAICDRCSFKRRHLNLRVEWSGLFVCSDCFDPRPPWLDAPYINPLETMPVPNARFDNDAENPNFIDTDNPITGDDL
jgi:hypothetical protein